MTLLTKSEFAKKAGVDLKTVYRWMKDGVIKPERRNPIIFDASKPSVANKIKKY